MLCGFLVRSILSSLITAGLAQSLDLQNAIIVTPDSASKPVRKAAQMLREEIEKRTQVRCSEAHAVATDGGPAIVVGVSSQLERLVPNLVRQLPAAPNGQEGFRIAVSAGAVVVAGNSDRAVVFQQPALFPWLNVLDNVAFGLRMKGVHRAGREAKAMEALRLVQLDGVTAKQAYDLSGGMQQRVTIARALASDPAVLLLDEPFAALDAMTRETLQEELNAIWRTTRKTCFFITHSVEEAVFLGTRLLVMSSRPGRIIHEDKLGFAQTIGKGRTGRAVKASAPFIAKREEILDTIIRAHSERLEEPNDER